MSGKRLLVVTTILAVLLPASTAAADVDGGASGTGQSISSWAVSTGGAVVDAPPGVTCGPWLASPALTAENGLADLGTTRVDSAGIVWSLFVRDCGAVRQYAWIPQLSSAQLAVFARDEVTKLLPRPDAVFSPDFMHRRESPFTLVGIPTYFAVPSAQWQPITATAQIPGLVVTAVATPTTLAFDAGEPGAARVTCAGPGVIPRSESDVANASGTCSYEYHHASSIAGGTFRATVTIGWSITWSASSGETGGLAAGSTSIAVGVPVREVQAIITHH